MMANSSVLLLLRSTTYALLVLVKKRYFAIILLADYTIFFLVKFVRSDLTYWLPVQGFFALPFSITFRVVVKFFTDFTACLHFRSPLELGGTYFTFNMFVALATSVGSAAIYYGEKKEPEDEDRAALCDPSNNNMTDTQTCIREDVVYSYIGCAWVVWFFSFLVVILCMKKSFRGFWYDTTSGPEFVVSHLFLAGTDDQRSQIFFIHERIWAGIRQEVKEWVVANWLRWEEDAPEFFSDYFRACIPVDMLPEDDGEDVISSRASMHMNASEKEVQGRARGHDSSNRRDAAKKMVADGGGVSKLLMTANKGNLPTIRKGEMQKLELKLGTARGAGLKKGPTAGQLKTARKIKLQTARSGNGPAISPAELAKAGGAIKPRQNRESLFRAAHEFLKVTPT